MGSFTRVSITGGAYKFSQNGNRIFIKFAAPKDISLGNLQASLESAIEHSQASNDGSGIIMTMKPGYRIRRFVGSSGTGFDLVKYNGQINQQDVQEKAEIKNTPKKALPQDMLRHEKVVEYIGSDATRAARGSGGIPQSNKEDTHRHLSGGEYKSYTTKKAVKPAITSEIIRPVQPPSPPAPSIPSAPVHVSADKAAEVGRVMAVPVVIKPDEGGGAVIIYAWPELTQFKLDDAANPATITFNKAADIEPVEVLPPFSGAVLNSLSSNSLGGKTVVHLDRKAASTISAAQDGNSVIINVKPAQSADEKILSSITPRAGDESAHAIDPPKPAEKPADGQENHINSDQQTWQTAINHNGRAIAFRKEGRLFIAIKHSQKENQTTKELNDWERIMASGDMEILAQPPGDGDYRAVIDEKSVVIKATDSSFKPQAIEIKHSGDEVLFASGAEPFISDYTDPLTGEKIVLALAKNHSIGISSAIANVPYNVLESVGGVVLVLKDEDIQVKSTDQGLLLKGISEYFSADNDNQASHKPEKLTEKQPEKKNCDGAENGSECQDHPSAIVTHGNSSAESAEEEAAPEEPHDESITQFRARLVQKIGLAKPHDKANALLELAEGLHNRGWAGESLGVLERLNKEYPEFLKQKNLHEKMGLTSLYMDKYDEAKKLFSEGGNKELEGLAGYISGHGELTYDITAVMQKLKTCPENIRDGIAAKILKRILETEDSSALNAHLAQLSSNGILTSDSDYYGKLATFAGSVAIAGSNYPKALNIWEELISDASDREFRARATLEKIKSGLNKGSIARHEALKQLEVVRYIWREPDFEVKLLPLLARLEEEEGQYKDALETMRHIVGAYPGTKESQQAAMRMNELFLEIFNKGQADKMPPIQALTLYYEFRELTPVGAEGDEMIRNLADRLTRMELLDRAAALLTHQVKYRLQGVEKAKVAARLAIVHLMNGHPELAVESIDYSTDASLPEDVITQRRLLKAQGLMDLNKYEEAASEISGLNGDDAGRLRSEIHWRQGNWGAVVNDLKPILPLPDEKSQLSAFDVENLLKLSVAYNYSGDAEGLKFLRSYLPAVDNETAKQQLEFFTSIADQVNASNFRTVSSSIANVTSYMDSLKNQLKDKNLSETVK